MLSNEDIKKAEINIRSYLNDGTLKKVPVDRNIVKIFRSRAEESLELANDIYNNQKSGLWVTVISYYSMYYMANAVLLNYGYKVGDKISHKITSDALVVYIKNKLEKKYIEYFNQAKNETTELMALEEEDYVADDTIESFEFERRKRSNFQYHVEKPIQRSKSATSLERAKEFLAELDILLE